jgi:hypothetical protein
MRREKQGACAEARGQQARSRDGWPLSLSTGARVAGAGARRHARADAPYGSAVDEAHARPRGGGAGLGWEQRCGKRGRLGRALGPDPRAQTHESRALCPRDPGRIRPPHAASHSLGARAGPADAAQLRGGQVPAQSRARCVNCSVGRSASLCSRGGSACVWRVMPRVPVHPGGCGCEWGASEAEDLARC